MLGHELAHVAQQRAGRVRNPLGSGLAVVQDHTLETEADRLGRRAAAHRVAVQAKMQLLQRKVLGAVAPPPTRYGATPTRWTASTLQPKACGAPAHQTRLRLPSVIQRQLDVNNPIIAGDIAHVRKLDAKVWLLEGHANDKVVIKIEIAGKAKADFEARWQYVTWVAQETLVGVPDAHALTQPELAVLANLNNTQEVGAFGPPTLQSTAATPQGLLFLKVAHVNMGKHLAKRVEEASEKVKAGGNMKVAMSKQDALVTLLSKQQTLESLGKIAVLDLVVNNKDRFRPGGWVNLKNIDFDTLNQPSAIDNIDPNNKVVGTLPDPPWPGEKNVKTKQARAEYAEDVIKFLFDKIALTGTPVQILAPKTHFITGMEQAVTILKSKKLELQNRARYDVHGAVGEIIASRLDDLQA